MCKYLYLTINAFRPPPAPKGQRANLLLLLLFRSNLFQIQTQIGSAKMSRRSLTLLKNLARNANGSGIQTRSVTYMPRPGDGAPRAVTLIPGDGIGPLVTNAVEQVMEAMHAPIFFEKYDVHGEMSRVPPEVMESIRKNKVCLKGGLKTPVGGGVSSLNVQLRKELDLFASLVNCFNLPGLPTRHENVDIVVIRENTEGEYAGLEHEVVPGVVESLKVKIPILLLL